MVLVNVAVRVASSSKVGVAKTEFVGEISLLCEEVALGSRDADLDRDRDLLKLSVYETDSVSVTVVVSESSSEKELLDVKLPDSSLDMLSVSE